jgi:hypothetical protein
MSAGHISALAEVEPKLIGIHVSAWVHRKVGADPPGRALNSSLKLNSRDAVSADSEASCDIAQLGETAQYVCEDRW